MVNTYMQKFWQWYERNFAVTTGISAALFILQLIHLFWLTTDVVAVRLVGHSLFHPSGIWEFLFVIVDYLEIPTLLSVSLIYINQLRRGWNIRSIIFLVLLNSQWFHIFWITDEVVEEVLTGSGSTVLPAWAAWIAILIDYLEIPVIVDTIVQFFRATRNHQIIRFLRTRLVRKDTR